MPVRSQAGSDEASRYIVVEGPIGVGKTSLARRLAESLGGQVLLEEADSNPFLERFYRGERNAALPAQLFFLFQRTRQLDELRQSDMFAALRVADYHIDKDRLFAGLNLDAEELALYDQVAARLAAEPPAPDLVIYLQARVDALLERIARRGVPHERLIDRAYLERVNEAYARHFHDFHDAPLLIVNASSIDPINNDSEYEQLLDHINRTASGRHFFNPANVSAIA